jgi:hypothetical protein
MLERQRPNSFKSKVTEPRGSITCYRCGAQPCTRAYFATALPFSEALRKPNKTAGPGLFP